MYHSAAVYDRDHLGSRRIYRTHEVMYRYQITLSFFSYSACAFHVVWETRRRDASCRRCVRNTLSVTLVLFVYSVYRVGSSHLDCVFLCNLITVGGGVRAQINLPGFLIERNSQVYLECFHLMVVFTVVLAGVFGALTYATAR